FSPPRLLLSSPTYYRDGHDLAECLLVILGDRLSACQVHRLEAGATKAAARRIPVFSIRPHVASGFLSGTGFPAGQDDSLERLSHHAYGNDRGGLAAT